MSINTRIAQVSKSYSLIDKIKYALNSIGIEVFNCSQTLLSNEYNCIPVIDFRIEGTMRLDQIKDESTPQRGE